ncbi:MAG: hypothetical protein ACRD4B_05830, partial [Acidobacteriota bacterium]
VVLLAALLTVSCGIANVEEKKMDQKIQDLIIQKVHNQQGWKTGEVRVDEVDRLRHGSCSFYTAGHTVRPISYQLNYAVLKGETVISLADDNAVSKIVDACGIDATPGWWAEIVTRFHQDLGSGVVLHDAKQNTGALQKIEAAKKEFAPPVLSGDDKTRTISFYLLEPESFVVYFVSAARNPDNTFTVTRNELA